tara:strand:+ start:259 stop:768 length:510 start_codon:yes stop_codon:yes gene_type:complete
MKKTKKYNKKHSDLPRRDHPDYDKLYYLKMKENNPERIKERNRKRRKKDKEILSAMTEEEAKLYWKEQYQIKREKGWHQAPKAKAKAKEYMWRRRGITDLTYERFTAAMITQDAKCASCGVDITEGWYADHNHDTGKFRAILCRTCNTGLGHYEKYKDKFEKYLDEYNT